MTIKIEITCDKCKKVFDTSLWNSWHDIFSAKVDECHKHLGLYKGPQQTHICYECMTNFLHEGNENA